MGMSRNPNTYLDVKRVFDAALAHGAARFRLPTPGKAQHFMQRAYRYRKLLFELEQEKFSHIPGYVASTPYDNLVLKKDKGSNEVLVWERRADEGELLTEDGKPLQPQPETGLSEDEAEMARRVATDLGLDIEED